MKEGGGRIGATVGMSNRGPVSVGTRGSSRSFGVSLSRDAGSVFGSKSFADSKPRAAISFNIPSSKSSSLVNINHGKNRTGLIDVTRSVRSNPIAPHETRFQFGLNIKNGTEKRSKTARVVALRPQGIFDINRPISKNAVVPFERKMQSALLRSEKPRTVFAHKLQEKSRSVKPRETRINSPISQSTDNGRKALSKEARVKVLEPARTLFDFSTKPALKAEPLRPIAPNIDFLKTSTENKIKTPEIRLAIPERTEAFQTVKPRIEQPKTKKEHKKRVKTWRVDRPHLTHLISTSPQISDLERQLVHADLSMAKKVILSEARVRGISLAEAQTQAIKRLLEKHKNKIVITPVEPLLSPDAVPQLQPVEQAAAGTKTKTEVLAQNVVKGASELQKNSKQVAGGGIQNPDSANNSQSKPPKREDPPREKEFFFEKQIDVNRKRIERAIQALDSLLKSHKTDTIPTGQGIADLISDSDSELQSEMAKPISKDGSLKKFKEAIGKLAHIHIYEFAEKLDQIVDKYPAIKLAVEKPNESAARKKAEYIYEGPINGKQAFFKDYQRVNGNFQGQSEKTYFIPSSNLPGAPVV